jgi:hypothetical protein
MLGMTAFDQAFLLGLLVGGGHFGGDGRQPQIVLKMHVRHEPLFQWLRGHVPGTALYGPYLHANRSYYQMMWRGRDLRDYLIPILDSLPWETIDPHSYGRYRAMKEKYDLS